MLVLAVYLFFLGLCLGSFVNALVWRLHNKKDWVKARSQCPHCNHKLAAKDLVPLLSWLWLKGKCRYCGKPISKQYPLVELTMGLTYLVSYLFWPESLYSGGQVILLITWLASSVGLMALLLYDLKWMLLPNKLIYPTLLIAVAGQLIYLVGFAADKPNFLLSWFLGVLVASGVFFLLFVISNGKWIGFGDVRLGLITGTLLHNPVNSFLMIFIASILGIIAVLPALRKGKVSMGTHLPYGPFLIAATAICLLFGESLIDAYLRLFVSS